MRVLNYQPSYFDDVVRLTEGFYKEHLTHYYTAYDKQRIFETLKSFEGENSKNLFLLITSDGKCVGLLAGNEIHSKLNGQKFFQEIIWYVEKPYGQFGFFLVKQARKMLKSSGFSNIIMSVIENGKSSKIERIYRGMGFSKIETHYLGRV